MKIEIDKTAKVNNLTKRISFLRTMFCGHDAARPHPLQAERTTLQLPRQQSFLRHAHEPIHHQHEDTEHNHAGENTGRVEITVRFMDEIAEARRSAYILADHG